MTRTHTFIRNSLFLSALIGGSLPGMVRGEEPAKQFLSRLKESGLYDVALKYLEISEKRKILPEKFQSEVPLEKVSLMQASLPSLRKPEEIEQRREQIEAGLREILKSPEITPSRSSAQTLLGESLRDRAMVAIAESNRPENAGRKEELREKARKLFNDAIALYVGINEELKPVLQNLAGNRAQKPEEIELRDRYQNEYRISEILHGKTLEFMSQTFDDESPEQKQWLDKAEQKFSEIIDKTTNSREAGRRILCLLYRGQIQSKLKKMKEARESFTRVADINEAGAFRTWKIEAIAGLIRLDMAENPPKLEAAVLRGKEIADNLTSQERIEPQGIDLQLALAQARVAYGKSIDEKKDAVNFKNNRRDARELLQSVLKTPGAHKEAASKLLAELGYEQVEKVDTKLPEPKNFEEAVAQARVRLDRAETAEQTIPLLKSQNATPDDINKVEQDVQTQRRDAIALYQKAIQLYKESDGREALLDTKYFLAYLYLRQDNYWDSLAVSMAVVQSNKTAEQSIKCGEFALVSLSRLIDASPPDKQGALIPSLERLAKLLIEIAPGTDGSKNAVDVLVTLSIREKKYDDAERYIEMSGGNSSSGASLLGQMLWRDYQIRQIEHSKNKTETTAEDKTLLAKAETLLKGAWDRLNGDKAESISITGTNALASIYLTQDKLEAALQVITDAAKGAVVLVDKNEKVEPKDKLEAYRLQLQAMVQEAGRPEGKPLESSQVASLVNRMKEIAAGDDSLLTNALRNLAYSISSKINQYKNPRDQAQVGGALGVLVRQLVAITSDVGILDSAGSSVFALADSLKDVSGLKPQVQELMSVADEAYSKIAAKPADEILAANRKPEEFQMRIAMAKAGSGKFEEAHKIFVESLSKSPTNITFQIAAARNLQEWSDNKNAELLQKAWAGSDPNEKGANAIWGWNRIAQVTVSKLKDENFKKIFFDARFNLVLCQRYVGLAQTDSAARKKDLERAKTALTQTKTLYPDLGTPELKANFEKLELDIEADLKR